MMRRFGIACRGDGLACPPWRQRQLLQRSRSGRELGVLGPGGGDPAQGPVQSAARHDPNVIGDPVGPLGATVGREGLEHLDQAAENHQSGKERNALLRIAAQAESRESEEAYEMVALVPAGSRQFGAGRSQRQHQDRSGAGPEAAFPECVCGHLGKAGQATCQDDSVRRVVSANSCAVLSRCLLRTSAACRAA